MKDALFGRPRRRRRNLWLPGVLALWLAAPLALAGADAALRSRYATGMAALEAENKLLKEQVSAQADQAEFYEDCIAEMATVVYA